MDEMYEWSRNQSPFLESGFVAYRPIEENDIFIDEFHGTLDSVSMGLRSNPNHVAILTFRTHPNLGNSFTKLINDFNGFPTAGAGPSCWDGDYKRNAAVRFPQLRHVARQSINGTIMDYCF
jgi:hypothetical protein